MSNVEQALDNLVEAIKESEQYNNYSRYLEQVKKEPGLKAEIDEYRLRNFELQNSADYDFSKMEEFEKEYEDFRENALVSDFLSAELDFCRMLQQISDRIVKEVHFE